MGRRNQERRKAKAKERRQHTRARDQRPSGRAASDSFGSTSGSASRSAHAGHRSSPSTAPPREPEPSEWIWRAFEALRQHHEPPAQHAIRQLTAVAGPGTPEAGILAQMLLDCLAAAWEAGWQPADVHRLTERRLNAVACAVLCDAMVAQLAAFSPSTVHPRWHEQLLAVEATHWWEASAGFLHSRLRFTHGHREGVIDAAVRLAHLLSALPVLPRLDALPGTYEERRSNTSRTSVDQRILTRVRALLAKAESTNFEAEADTFTAGAQALMARHSIDVAMLADEERGEADGTEAVRIGIDRPYEKPKAWLLSVVAEANRCRVVWSGELGFATAVGFPADLQATETIFTSLLVQSAHAMAAQGSRTTPWGSSRTRSFRHSFLMSYAERIGERLSQVIREETCAAQERERSTQHATATGVPSHGRELVRVLAERTEEVEDATARLFPHVVSRSYSGGTDAEGWVAGRRAADTAHLGAGPALEP